MQCHKRFHANLDGRRIVLRNANKNPQGIHPGHIEQSLPMPPALINAPGSTLRFVSTSEKWRVHMLNDSSCSSRRTLASPRAPTTHNLANDKAKSASVTMSFRRIRQLPPKPLKAPAISAMRDREIQNSSSRLNRICASCISHSALFLANPINVSCVPRASGPSVPSSGRNCVYVPSSLSTHA